MGEETKESSIFIKIDDGKYQALGITEIKNSEIEETYNDIGISKCNEYSGELEVEIKDKETIRKLKKIAKTDKDIKTERRFNKDIFRNFIKNRYR